MINRSQHEARRLDHPDSLSATILHEHTPIQGYGRVSTDLRRFFAMLSLTRWSFGHIFIPLFLWTTRTGSEGGYKIWERVVSRLAKIVGQFARRRRSERQSPIEGMMHIVDWADELIGARGNWVEIGSTRAVKRITSCPHAERLKASPAFCTKLGVAMGHDAFSAYYPEAKVCYAIPQAKSQGASYCEYILIVFPGKGSRVEDSPTQH